MLGGAAFFEIFRNRRTASSWFAIVAVSLIILIGLRDEVGGDWWNYLLIYKWVAAHNISQAFDRTEPGYAALNIIATRERWGIWFPNLVCATIFTWGLMAFCRRQMNPSVALLIALPYFIIGVGMGYTRQSAAVGFVLLAINQYSRGSAAGVIVYVALAMMFHTSAIIVAPIFSLAVAKRGLFTFLAVAAIGAILLYEFAGHLQLLVSTYSASKYTAGGAIPRMLMNVVPAAIFLAFRQRFVGTDAELRLWIIFSLMVVVSLVVFFVIPSSTVVDRLGIYLIPLQLFVMAQLPTVFGSNSRPNTFILVTLLVYSFAIEFVWLTWGTWGHAWLPYRNYIWSTGPGKPEPRGFRAAD